MELFKLFGTIAVNNTEANQNIDDTTDLAEKSSSRLQTALTGFGTAAGIIAAGIGAIGTGIGALAKGAIENFAEYEQLTGGVETLFGESAEKVMQYSSQAFETAGLSANQYMETVTGFSASLLQSLGGDTEAAAEYANTAITDMSDNANKMGTSMESIQNAYQGFAKQNYTMLDNLKLGYGGTKEEMERLLEDATAISGVEYDISSYADIVDAIHVMQTELGITGTTAKEASTTISGSIGMMKSAWTNFITGMADDNQNFDTLLNNLVDSVVTAANNIVPRIATTLPRLVNGLVAIVQALSAYVPGIIEELLPSIIEGAANLMEGIIQVLPDLIDIILESIPMLINAVLQIVVAIVQALPDIIVNIVDALPELIQMIVVAILENLPLLIEGMIQLIVGIVTALPQIITALLEAMPEIISLVVVALLKALPQLIEGVLQMIIGVAKQLPELCVTIWNVIPDLFNTLVEQLRNAFPGVMSWLEGVGQSIIGYIRTMFTFIRNVIDAAFQIITLPFRFIWENCKDTVMEVWNTIIDVLKTQFDVITSTVTNVFNAVYDKITGVFNKVRDTISPVINTIKDNISKVFNEVKSTVTTIWDAVKDAMTKPIEIARDTIRGIVDTIKGFFSGLNLEFPNIKLPHFGISPSGWKIGDLLEGSIPSLSIQWYAKAMEEPYLFKKPTVIGGKGFGEAGDEMVYGKNALMNDIKNASESGDPEIKDKLNIIIKLLELITKLGIRLDSGALVGELAPMIDDVLGERSEGAERGGRLAW